MPAFSRHVGFRETVYDSVRPSRLDRVSAQAGWYPDPGGVPNLYRYWDGRAWSAATSANPQSPAPSRGLVPGPPQQGTSSQEAQQQQTGQTWPSQQPYGPGHPGQGTYTYGSAQGQPGAYAGYQAEQRKSPVGWWVAAAVLVVVVAVIGVIAVRAIARSTGDLDEGTTSQPSQGVCPQSSTAPSATRPDPNDGRVHGGPVSYPRLGDPWSAPYDDDRVPFGRDVQKQDVLDQQDYNGTGNSWVASVLVAELMAGDGFFTPEQGAQIVVRCILGAFYGDATVESNVTVDKAAKIDSHDAWLIESELSFDIPGLIAKGELLIVAVVKAGDTAGLYYASIPNTQPELVKPARKALADLRVDG